METAGDVLALKPATVIEAVHRIVVDCQPETILAFGSGVCGQTHADGDLDLLVLFSEKVPDHSSLRRRLYRLLADLPFAKNIIVSDPGHFALWSKQINGIYHDAFLEGVALWQHGRLESAAIKNVCS